jgi:hypothetical protein
MKKAVFCIVKNQTQADQIINDLQRAGFPNREISVVLPQPGGFSKTTSKKEGKSEKQNRSSGSATSGAPSGVGGAIGLLNSLGPITIPGLGVFVAAGPVMVALSESAIEGGTGFFVDTLSEFGLPEQEAKRYQEALQSGGHLICCHVETSDECDKAKKILEKNSGKDISTSSEKATSRR